GEGEPRFTRRTRRDVSDDERARTGLMLLRRKQQTASASMAIYLAGSLFGCSTIGRPLSGARYFQ
ncbi:MAG TPA: hypothetical protein VGC89_09155, partial [Pyrinomonadaceae bacterium]